MIYDLRLGFAIDDLRFKIGISSPLLVFFSTPRAAWATNVAQVQNPDVKGKTPGKAKLVFYNVTATRFVTFQRQLLL
jgi:hypothetical protein